MSRKTAGLLASLGAITLHSPALATETPYFDPTVVEAGSAAQMARDAKFAIECGFDVVTVRPWKDGDIRRPAQFITRPMSLIVQASRESDLNKVVGCLDDKTGASGAIRS